MISKFTIIVENAENSSIQEELKNMIEASLKTTDKKTVADFISAYQRDPESTQITGLINDADVYDFYLKYQEDIDKKLNDEQFFSKTPEELNVYGLYDYVVVGTKEAVKLLIGNLNSSQEEQAPQSAPTF